MDRPSRHSQPAAVFVAPSILAADFGRLADEVRAVDKAGADWIHVDVMDGHFVPNLTIGPAVVEAIRRATDKPVDVHLMISHPERYLHAFAAAGADSITVHVEACVHLDRIVEEIRGLGKKAGVSLNPHTPESVLQYVIERLDLILVMSVNPGFGGQKFLPSVLPKISALRARIDRDGLSALLQIDGGINADTAPKAIEAGSDVLVAGSAVFGEADYKGAIEALRKERK